MTTKLSNQGPVFTISGLPTDGVTDSAPAINNALSRIGAKLSQGQSLGQAGKAIAFIPGGTYTINSMITVPTGITLKGETKAPPYPSRVAGFSSNQNMFTGTEIKCSDTFNDENAILLNPDNTNVEDIILDGHFIPCGTTWTQINVTTAQGRWISTSFIKLPVNDNSDFRIGSLKIDNDEVPVFRISEYMEYQLQALGGDGIYTFSLESGSLPNGLSLSASGLISGIATDLQTTFPRFQVDDNSANSSRKVFTMGTILDEIKTRDIPPQTAGASYTFSLESWYNTAGLTWEAQDLPTWMSLSSTGVLTGLNTTTFNDVETYSFKVKLFSSTGTLLDTRVLKSELRFADDSIQIYGERRIKPEQNVAFSYLYYGSGGFGDYTWSINTARSNGEVGNATTTTATSPYVGLTLNSTTGEISGIATTLGSNTYYLRATSNIDNNIFFETQRIIEVIEAGETPKIISRSLASANKGTAYSYQFNIEDIPAAKPYTYEAVNLPTGLSMDQNGLISGTPTGANFVNGVRIQWSDNVKNCTIRGFRSGGGIYSENPSNVHRISGCLIAVCDSGFFSLNQTYDSHFTDLYIYNCRVGLNLGPGSAGLTVSDTRIEFIHEDGASLDTAHENDFNSIYFDTCGRSSIKVTKSNNLVVTGCRFYRSGRLIRGIGTKLNSKANRDLSNHVYISDSNRCTFTGNTFDVGTKDGGDGIFLNDHFADNVRPYVGFRIKNSKELTIVGNNLTGCVSNAYDADLTLFGENSYEGYNLNSNTQTDLNLKPLNPEVYNQYIYIPNQCFQVWQRDNAFILPPSADVVKFHLSDFWDLRRDNNTVIDVPINASRSLNGPKGLNYIHIDKAANTTTAPVDNFQTLELENVYSKGLEFTSNKNIVISYWARSANNNNIVVRVSQYADSPDNSFQSFNFSANVSLSSTWTRYQHYLELGDLNGISFGPNAILNIIFRLDKFDQAYDFDLTGVQIDFVHQTPFAQDLRIGSFDYELNYAKKYYQKSKDYTEYFASWARGLRYDINGANWGNSYEVVYSPLADAAALTTTVTFETSLISHPGYPDQSAGILPNIKLLNPQHIVDRTNANKYTFNGTNSPASYIERANTKATTFSARNSASSPVAGNVYAYHWIYTSYEEDINPLGGYN